MCVSETANYRHLLMRDNMNGKSSSERKNSGKSVFMRLPVCYSCKCLRFLVAISWSQMVRYPHVNKQFV